MINLLNFIQFGSQLYLIDVLMNVLGKIKSKKLKAQQIQQKRQQVILHHEQTQQIYTTQTNSLKKQQQLNNLNSNSNSNNIYSKQIKSKHLQVQFGQQDNYSQIINNNNNSQLIKQKQKNCQVNKQKTQHQFLLFSHSVQSSSIFHTKRQSKKGIYFQQQRESRINPFLAHSKNIKQANTFSLNTNKINSPDQSSSFQLSFQQQESQQLDFQFLLSNRQKKQIKKSINQSKAKYENVNEIQKQLKEQYKNKEIICFYIKKWHYYGDVYMFQGEIEYINQGKSHKRVINQFVNNYANNTNTGKYKVKISCPIDLIMMPETLGRMYLNQIDFLSENQAIVFHDYLLKTVQKSNRIRRIR